jgi:hypothetical protein
MALEGSLSVFQLPEILQMISLQNKTGILTVQGEHDIIAVSFLHGSVVAADALNQTTEEGLGQILSGDRVVRADQFAAVLAEQQSTGGRLADLLLQRGLLTRPQLLKALRSQTYNLLLQTLRWKDGSFKFYGGEEVSFEEGFLPISVEELLIRSLSEIQDPAQLPDPTLVYEAVPSDRSVRMMDHTFAGVREGSGVWMKAEEKALLEKLDGRRTGEELGRDLGLDEHKLRYALYHLQQEGLARVAEGASSKRAPQAPTAPAAPAAPAPKAQPAPPPPPAPRPAPAAPRPAPKPGGGVLRTDTDHGAGSGPRRLEGGSKSGVMPPRSAARAEDADVATPPLAIGRLLAAALVGLLVAAAVWRSGRVFFPLPWQGEERDIFERTQRTAQFLKIDRAARTHFLVEGRYPDDLSRLVAIGTLDPRDERDAAGRRLAYSTDGVSYTLQPVERGEALAELGSTEGITGDFLLDADFLKIPRGRDEAPLVLID